MTAAAMDITRLVPWFGANAANADVPARLLAGCTWVYVPFAGSMAEVPHFVKAGAKVMVSDLHDELIQLAQVVANYRSKEELAQRLAHVLFHPGSLEAAQNVLRNVRHARIGDNGRLLFKAKGDDAFTKLDVAAAYFVHAWMSSSGKAGLNAELQQRLALRYDAGGGDPVVRYRSAVRSLDAWNEILEGCSITRESAFEVISRLHGKVTAPAFDLEARGNRLGLYCDSPWPDDGDWYLHAFGTTQHRMLAEQLNDLPHVQICVRFKDHPLVRSLYPESAWTWHRVGGRDQHNQGVDEVFLTRRRA